MEPGVRACFQEIAIRTIDFKTLLNDATRMYPHINTRDEKIRATARHFHLYFLLIESSSLRISLWLGTRQMHGNLHAANVTGNTGQHVTRG